MKVMASEAEHRLITTNPEELLKLREEGKIQPKQQVNRPTYQQYSQPEPDKYITFDEKGNVRPGYEPGAQNKQAFPPEGSIAQRPQQNQSSQQPSPAPQMPQAPSQTPKPQEGTFTLGNKPAPEVQSIN